MLYIVDTNILITPHRKSNPIDIHPTYWNKMSEILEREDVISIDKVKNEIYKHQDTLYDWCVSNIEENDFWLSSANAINEYAEIQNWAQNERYNQRALSQFADSKNADPFLVAFALNKKRIEEIDVTIVTLEVSDPNIIREVKLPNVCLQFDIRYIDNNDFFREINISF